MPNENEIIAPEQENQEEVNAIDIIAEMRANTVSKDKYNKLVEDNQKLMKALANGETIQVEAPNTPNIDELRNEFFKFETKNDLQIAQDILNLRNGLLEAGQADPFLPNGRKANITTEDIADAQRVADLLQYAVDASNGDNKIFLAQFESKILDSTIPNIGNKRRGR